MTVALYTRLSPKPNGGGYEGVDDQIAWGHAYAAKAWPGEPIEVFADRGKSAGRDDVRREDFERLREWVQAGKVTHLWAVEQSRVTRREIEWFEFAADLDAAGITELHTNRDGIVRVGDEVAGIKAVLSASERKKMLRRLHDTLSEKAAKGEPPASARSATSTPPPMTGPGRTTWFASRPRRFGSPPRGCWPGGRWPPSPPTWTGEVSGEPTAARSAPGPSRAG